MLKQKIVIIGGTFDSSGGKSSYIVEQLMKTLGAGGINGGYLTELEIDFTKIDTLIWMPNIDNSEDKILPQIKLKNPKMLLIQSKRVRDSDFQVSDMVGRLLTSHSLLGIMITKVSGAYFYRVVDPLGNQLGHTSKIGDLARVLYHRIIYIKSLSRIGSWWLGPRRSQPDCAEFLEVVKSFGDRFSKFVTAVNPNRLLGNASTRCESGFPAIKHDKRIYVSKRNVDKKTLNLGDFVEVESLVNLVGYYGFKKPSVDSPVQIMLFDHFKNIKYIIHGHAYVKGAAFTTNKIPCGFLEEFEDITEIYPDPNTRNFVVNLKGHGCLIACDNLEYFENIKLVGRTLPEY